MKLIVCPKCCESNLHQEGGFFKCNVCGSLFTEEEKRGIEEMIEAAMASGAQADLGKLRRLLRDELEADYPDPDAVIDACDRILRVLPDDPIASVIKAFFRRDTHRGQYQRLISNLTEPLNDYQKKFLYPYIIDLCEACDGSCVHAFLKNQNDESLFPRLDKALKQREEEIDLFANIKRDVFICHANADFSRIKPILDRLEEEEGFSCWYSERNLPIDTRNYNENIRKTIANCAVFLVFASSQSMASKPVRDEIEYADSIGKKSRLEYRLEDKNNNALFRYFFEGIQWVDGASEEHFDLLAERILELLKPKSPSSDSTDLIPDSVPDSVPHPAPKPEPKPASQPVPKREPKPKPAPASPSGLDEALAFLKKAKCKPFDPEKPEDISPVMFDNPFSGVIIDGARPRLSADGESVYYGIYPQTVVDDAALIKKLEAEATQESNGWYYLDGHYYVKETANPCENGANYVFSSGTRIEKNKAYWFRCEPIQWKILKREGAEPLVLSAFVLDSRAFGGRDNNYGESEIRAWLNGEFLYRAMKNAYRYVSTSRVDNSAASVGCGASINMDGRQDTSDKVFLLSYAEASDPDLFPDDKASRTAKPTDYALAKGAYKRKGWEGAGYWLRSPDADLSNSARARTVACDGWIDGGSPIISASGVRPALRIKLEDIPAQKLEPKPGPKPENRYTSPANEPQASPIDDFEFEIKEGKAILKRYKGKGENVVVPSSFKGAPVAAVAHRAFSGCKGLKTIVFPDSVENIDYMAVEFCPSLERVRIGKSLKRLHMAFTACNAILAMEISEENPHLTSIDGVVYDHDKKRLLFYPRARKGEYRVLPSVTSIGLFAFSDCAWLTKIGLPSGLWDLGGFSNCMSLESISIPNVEDIPTNSFGYCSSLRNVVLSPNLRKIGDYAFMHCPNLGTIEIPSSIKTVGKRAFAGSGGEIIIRKKKPLFGYPEGFDPDWLSEFEGKVKWKA